MRVDIEVVYASAASVIVEVINSDSVCGMLPSMASCLLSMRAWISFAFVLISFADMSESGSDDERMETVIARTSSRISAAVKLKLHVSLISMNGVLNSSKGLLNTSG